MAAASQELRPRDAGVRPGSPLGGLDPRRLRREFPIFEHNPGLVFLDSGASAQKPRQVIDGIAPPDPERDRPLPLWGAS